MPDVTLNEFPSQLQINTRMITKVSQSIYVYKATCLRVLDGDTIDAELDLGFKIRWSVHIRFSGFDAYETRGATTHLIGTYAKNLVNLAFERFGSTFYFKSEKDQIAIYNRAAGRLYLETEQNGERAFVDLIASLKLNGCDKSGNVPYNAGEPKWVVLPAADIMSLFA